MDIDSRSITETFVTTITMLTFVGLKLTNKPIPGSLTIGESGTGIFEDVHLFEKNAHFNRERVPERVVHANGTGAHGYFEVTQYAPPDLPFCPLSDFPTY